MYRQFEHMFPCSANEFWGMFLNPDFNRSFWLEKTGAVSHDTLLTSSGNDGVAKRRFRVTLANLELPSSLERLLGGPLSFVEEGEFNPVSGEYSYSQAYSVLADRAKVRGTIRTRTEGAATVRVADVEIDVKLYGLGGLAELAASSNLKWGYAAEAEFGAQWLARPF